MIFWGHLGHPCLFVEGAGDESEAPSVSEGSGMERGDSAGGADLMDHITHFEG